MLKPSLLTVIPVRVRPVDEYDVIVPDDEFLLVSARLLSPERDDPLLVADEDGPGLAELPALSGGQTLADLVDILLAVAGGVAALAGGGDDARQASLGCRERLESLSDLLARHARHHICKTLGQDHGHTSQQATPTTSNINE